MATRLRSVTRSGTLATVFSVRTDKELHALMACLCVLFEDLRIELSGVQADPSVPRSVRRYATFGVASLGLTPLRTRRGQNDRRWWNTVYGLLHEHFLVRPLHRSEEHTSELQ